MKYGNIDKGDKQLIKLNDDKALSPNKGQPHILKSEEEKAEALRLMFDHSVGMSAWRLMNSLINACKSQVI